MEDIIDEILDLFVDMIASSCIDNDDFINSREEYAIKLIDLFDKEDKLKYEVFCKWKIYCFSSTRSVKKCKSSN